MKQNKNLSFSSGNSLRSNMNMGAGFLENCEKSHCCISGLVTGTPSGQTYFHLTKPVYMYVCVRACWGWGMERRRERLSKAKPDKWGKGEQEKREQEGI